MKIIDPNSPLILALGKLSDIVICNFLFVVFSLPLFTVGAAYTALCRCMQLLIEDREDDLIVKDFWRAFKKNFKQATAIWLLCLLVILVLAAFYFTANIVLDQLGRAYLVPFFLMTIVFVCGVQYVFPILARYRLRIRDILKDAWLLSIAALPWTICCLGILAVAIYLTFVMMTIDMCVFVWGVLGFGVVCYLQTFLFRLAFKKLDPAELARQQAHVAPPEALFTDEAHMGPETHMHSISSYSNPNWNRQEYPLSDRSDVQGRGNNRDWKRKKRK